MAVLPPGTRPPASPTSLSPTSGAMWATSGSMWCRPPTWTPRPTWPSP